jgi:signal-transduction protein with cAMP-binding, CBS, and nucleotidyltransferase domain
MVTKTTTVNEFMTRKFETIQEVDSIKQASRKMKDKNVSSLVVVDQNGKPNGLVTERDIVRKVYSIEDVDLDAIRVADILSSPLITINSNSTPEQAANLLLKNKIRHLVVVEKEKYIEKMVGIITPMDFTRYREKSTDINNEQMKKEDNDTIENIMKYYRD